MVKHDDDAPKKKGKKTTVRPIKRNQQQEEQPQKTAEQEKAEQRKREAEERKLREDELRASLKPKEYSIDEIEAYYKLVEEANNLFAEINLRQMNVEESVRGESREGEQQEESKENAIPEEEEKKSDEENRPPTEQKIVYGKRLIQEQFLQYELKFLCEESKKTVPEPMWPDPEKEPLPQPSFHQIVKRPNNRNERPAITLFSIWTPKEQEPVGEGEEPKPIELTNKPTRWVVPAGSSRKLHIKFFSKNVGTFDQNLPFEIVGSTKTTNL